MKRQIQQMEIEIGKTLPNAYTTILASFDTILLVALANVKEVDFHSVDRLLQPYDQHHKRYQIVRVLMEDYFIRNNTTRLYSHDIEKERDGSPLTESFYFGKMDDATALFINLKDMSIWEFWQDDCSVSKISNSFEEFISGFTIIEKDDWSQFLKE